MKRIGFVVMLAGLSLLAGCSQITVLDPKSDTGKDQAYLIWLSLAIMFLVLIVVFILFTWFVIKYRYTEKRKYEIPVDVIGDKRLELTYTIIPIILLIILAIPTAKITLEQSPGTEAFKDAQGVEVNVIGKQFAWDFEYENGEEDTNKLVLPEGEPAIFHLKSEDVVHSFWIPELAGKVDLYPHETLTYRIENPEKGEYEGKCAEFCGPQHSNMTFDVEVVSEDDYKDYLDDL